MERKLTQLKESYVIGLLFLFINVSSAQNTVVKGVLIDGNTKTPVEFANVVLFSVADSVFIKGALTDSAGIFELKNIKAGMYFLKISFLGYQTITTKSFLIMDQQAIMDFGSLVIAHDAAQLQEINITAEKPAFERRFDKTILNVSTSNLYKTATTAIDVLKRAPGVEVDTEDGIKIKNTIKPMVLVDGKPILMSEDELVNYLKTLGQEQIESIEIIDNPSAKYDAEYKGIINIKLKRDKNLGWKGTLSTYVMQNTHTGAGGAFTIGYHIKKFNFFGMYGYNKEKSRHLGYGKQYLAADTYLLQLKADEFREGNKNSIQAGTDYLISDKQTIGILLNGYNNQGKRNGRMDNKLSSAGEEILFSNILSRDNQKRHFENYSLNANYDADFKKSHLTVNFSEATYEMKQDQYITNVANTYTISQIRSLTGSTIDLIAGQIDYTYKFSKFNLDIGTKAASTNTSSNLQYDTLSVFNNWESDPGRTNRFSYLENILAGYANINISFGKKWKLQAGMRAEQTQSEGYSQTTDNRVTRNYILPLPGLTIGYQPNDNNSLDLSYSRRLERPSFDLLNPFRTYNGPYGYIEGNPFLLPVINNSVSLNYTYKQLTTGLGYTYLKDKITQLAQVDKNVTGYTIVNFNDATYLNWNLTYPIKINKWWNMQNTVATYYLDQKVMYNTTAFTVKNLSYYVEGNQTVNLLRGYTASLHYMYYSNSKYDIYSSSAIYQFDISFQKGFFKNKLDVKLNVEDIFYSQFTINTANVENYHAENYEKHDTRYVKLNLTYKFGRSEYNRKDNQSSGTEEQNRLRNQ